MSGITIEPGALPSDRSIALRENYLNVKSTVASWLLTTDHKRIAILYMCRSRSSSLSAASPRR